MTRSQALLTGANHDRIQALAIKEELASARSSLEDSIKGIEKQMEDLRNKRQETSNAFENFDQKSNQRFNIRSTVLKTMKEQEQAIVRNRLQGVEDTGSPLLIGRTDRAVTGPFPSAF